MTDLPVVPGEHPAAPESAEPTGSLTGFVKGFGLTFATSTTTVSGAASADEQSASDEENR